MTIKDFTEKAISMTLIWGLVLIVLLNGLTFSNGISTNATRPSVVNVGTIFSLSSVVGKVAKLAIDAAVEDVNSNPALLPGTELKLTMQDSNYSGFLGIIEGMSCFFLKKISLIDLYVDILATT